MERILYIYWCHSFCSSPHPLQLDDHTRYTEIKILCAIQRIYLALNLLHFWKFLTLLIMSCLFCLLWTDLVWFSFCLYGTSLFVSFTGASSVPLCQILVNSVFYLHFSSFLILFAFGDRFNLPYGFNCNHRDHKVNVSKQNLTWVLYIHIYIITFYYILYINFIIYMIICIITLYYI